MEEKIKIAGTPFILRYTQNQIEKRIREMAYSFERETDRHYTMIPVMTGAFYFSASFLSHLDFPYRIFTLNVHSYEGMESKGAAEVFFSKDSTWIKGADIIILEDIVETGWTVSHLEKYFKERGARSVSVITLFYKPGRQKHPCSIRQFGFEISDEFIVGYGLDFNEEGRWLKAVYQKE